MSGPGRFTTAINEMGLTTPLSVAAAGFAGAGVPVFPCAPGGKHPITEHGFHEATTRSGIVAGAKASASRVRRLAPLSAFGRGEPAVEQRGLERT